MFIILLASTLIEAAVIYLAPNILKYSAAIFLLGIPLIIINSVVNCQDING